MRKHWDQVSEKMSTIPSPSLLLLTDRTRLTPNWTLAQAIAPAITGGCNLVVLRESDLPANHRRTVAGFVVDGVKCRVPLVVAEDAALAAEIGAEGAHFSSVESIASARELLGANALIGVSVRDRPEAERGMAAGADYLLIEYEWSSPERVLAHFRALRDGISVPLLIGTDMAVELVSECVAAGAAGIAICAPAMAAYDRTTACREYADALTRAADNKRGGV
jgi:thiamine monophosphate synthase